ncbi:SLBB domain-containing protein [Lentisalinibacter salinarum]|uniref:SLBB domain-containing protein n=1 Tax=Lentisalinibacter salinarum TaxID=2992239 RepID=UPI003870AC71
MLLVVAGVLMTLAPAGYGQSVSLTPEQQRMLNQLPPSQRQAALEQLRNLRTPSNGQKQASSNGEDQAMPAMPMPVPEDEEPEGPPVFASGDTLVLNVTARETEGQALPPAEEQSRDVLMQRLLNGNPYKLDALGRLVLAGVGEIPLSGLTEEQATMRLAADASLSQLSISVNRLPLDAVGVEALEPFGYELFERDSSRLHPNQAVPVAADYVVGPGDTLRIQLFGNQNADYELPVERNGMVRFPQIGPISVAGRSYASVQQLIGERVREQFIGTQVSVTLGELRALQVFVVGDVKFPGSYSVDPMSTITSALALSGGVAPQGSLRRIQLKRQGEVVQTLDVYDVLLRGDTRSDIRLQSGDVVFVPPVGTRVTVAGEVNRPAIYEYRGAANIQDVIGLAGGLKPTAYKPGVKIERLEPGAGFLVLEANQNSAAGRTLKVADGDTVVVPKGVGQLERAVRLVGNVQRPGDYQWRDGLRITDLLRSSRDLKENSDLNYVLIRREVVPNAELAVVSVDLQAAWRSSDRAADVLLKPRDTVYVFDLEVGREHIVSPLIDELRLRSSRAQPLPVARIGGRVNADGEYPLESGMRIADLVRAGGGLDESAYLGEAELTRYELVDGEARKTELIEIDLEAALAGDPAHNVTVQSFDYLNIKEIPRWRDQEFVEILGEVAFPGRYPIKQGETLKHVLERAGGLTDMAFAEGSVFTRQALKEREREQLDVLANRLESDLASMSLSDPGQSEAVSTGRALLEQLRSAQPVGRLVIDLPSVVAGTIDDLILRDGDRLIVPVQAQEVTVIGEVQYTTSHLHDPGLSREDYIDKSGGYTRKADKERTYVVRANGEVVVGRQSKFFARSSDLNIRPGDTIVAPLHADKVKPITLWSNATQIVYNLAIAAAAVNSF